MLKKSEIRLQKWHGYPKKKKKKEYIWLSYMLVEEIRGFNSHGFLRSHEGWKSTLMFQESWDSHAHAKTWNIINYKVMSIVSTKSDVATPTWKHVAIFIYKTK